MDSTLIIALVALAIVVGALVLGFSRKRALPKQATPLPPAAPAAAKQPSPAAKRAEPAADKAKPADKARPEPAGPPVDVELEGPDLQELVRPPKAPPSAAPPPFRAKDSVRPPIDDVTAL